MSAKTGNALPKAATKRNASAQCQRSSSSAADAGTADKNEPVEVQSARPPNATDEPLAEGSDRKRNANEHCTDSSAVIVLLNESADKQSNDDEKKTARCIVARVVCESTAMTRLEAYTAKTKRVCRLEVAKVLLNNARGR